MHGTTATSVRVARLVTGRIQPGSHTLCSLTLVLQPCYTNRTIEQLLIQRGGGTGPAKPRQPMAVLEAMAAVECGC